MTETQAGVFGPIGFRAKDHAHHKTHDAAHSLMRADIMNSTTAHLPQRVAVVAIGGSGDWKNF